MSLENFQDTTQDIGKSAYKIKLVLENFKKARDELYYPSSPSLVSYLTRIISIDETILSKIQDRYQVSK